MSRLEVLCATMHQKDFSKVEQMHLTGDAVLANQDDRFDYAEMPTPGGVARLVTTPFRGVGRNRNLAVAYGQAEIFLFADDDMVYHNDYEATVLRAFDEHPEADILIFNIGTLFADARRHAPAACTRFRRVSRYGAMSYGCLRVAVRADKLRRSNLCFSQLFGGGCRYSSGEDTLWLYAALRGGLRVYTYPAEIAQIDLSSSSWFTGYHEKLFFDKGAFYQAAHPVTKPLWAAYFAWRTRRLCDMGLWKKLSLMHSGMKGYRKEQSYEDFKKGIKHE